MVFVGDERPGGGQEHLHELGHLADDAEGAQGRLLAQVRVGRLEQPLHLGRQVARHLRRRDGAQRAQRQPHHELHRTVQIAAAHTKFKKKETKTKENKFRCQYQTEMKPKNTPIAFRSHAKERSSKLAKPTQVELA